MCIGVSSLRKAQASIDGRGYQHTYISYSGPFTVIDSLYIIPVSSVAYSKMVSTRIVSVRAPLHKWFEVEFKGAVARNLGDQNPNMPQY